MDYVTRVKAGDGREMFTIDVGIGGGCGAAVVGEIWRSYREVITLPVQSRAACGRDSVGAELS